MIQKNKMKEKEKMKRTGKESATLVAKALDEIWSECNDDEALITREIIERISIKNDLTIKYVTAVGGFDTLLRPREDLKSNKNKK